MNGSPVAGLVRGWVRLYTHGMPAELRAARRDEIDDDMWCEHDEAATLGHSARSLDANLLLRLLFGMPADINWRLSYQLHSPAANLERSSSMDTRTLGTLAIVSGLIFGTLFVLFIPFSHAVWTGTLGVYALIGTIIGAIAFAAAAVGVASRFQDRIGAIGGLGAMVAAFGALVSMVGFIVPLVVGTAMLTFDLARIRVVSWVIPIVHMATTILIVGLAIAQPNLDDLGIRALFVALMVPYLLTWIWMGVSLFRGVPAAARAPSG
jgi:hypothetical protein